MQSFKLQKNSNGEQPEKKGSGANTIGSVLGLILILGAVWYFWIGGGIEVQTEKQLDNIHNQVASDAVEQYQIAKRNGNAIDICVHAGLVSAAYIQAKDEANYSKWKDIEEEDCKNAGVPLE